MAADWTAPPIPSAASLVGLGEDEYDLLRAVFDKATGHVRKKQEEAAAKAAEGTAAASAAEGTPASSAAPAEVPDEALGFFPLLGRHVVRSAKAIPVFFRKFWIPLLVMAVVWVVFQVLLPLFIFRLGAFLSAFSSLIGALTGSYANFLGKAVYAGVFMGTVMPLYSYYKASGAKDLIAKYKKVRGMLRSYYKTLGRTGWIVFLASAGTGLAVANVLSTNNGFGTWFVSFLAAFALINAMALGGGQMRTKLFHAGYRDLAKLFRSPKAPSADLAHAVFGAFAAGLAGSLVPAVLATPFTVWNFLAYSKLSLALSGFLSGFQAISGYLFGGLAVLAAIVLSIVWRKPKTPAAPPAPASPETPAAPADPAGS